MKVVKIKVHLDYGSVAFDVVGLVKKEEFENCKDFGLGYIEDSDMNTDAEGFNMFEILEGRDNLEAYWKISEGVEGVEGVATHDIIE